MRTWLGILAVVPLSLMSAAAAIAQDAPTASLPPPITLTYVDGRVDIARRDGVQAAQPPDVLEGGDRLITADGRAELVFADGSLVHVDRGSDLRFDDDVPLSVVRGRVVVRTAATDAALDVGTPVGIVRLEPRGQYLITARDLDGESTIAVLSGRATLTLPTADVPIAADDEVAVDPRGLEPRWTRVGVQRDAFTDWAARRVDDMDHARAAQPLPVELSAYAPSFATYGRWDTLPIYGSVWFPTAAPGWRPYANGSWRYTRYGWTWIDSDPWGWPVHHYGRWGRHACARLVLDAAPHLGSGMGRLGGRGRPHRLGAARLELPSGRRFLRRRARRSRGRRGPGAGRWCRAATSAAMARSVATTPTCGTCPGRCSAASSHRATRRADPTDGSGGWRRRAAMVGRSRPASTIGRRVTAGRRAPRPCLVRGVRPRGPAATPLPTPRDDGGGRVTGGGR